MPFNPKLVQNEDPLIHAALPEEKQRNSQTVREFFQGIAIGVALLAALAAAFWAGKNF